MKCVYSCECGYIYFAEYAGDGFPPIAITCKKCGKYAGLSTKLSNHLNRKEKEKRDKVLKSLEKKKK
jgi:hypothetical protein